MRSLSIRLAALSVIAFSVAGCAGSSGTALPAAGFPNNGQATTNQFVANSNGEAAIRFIHGSPDAGNVDICFDNKVVASNVVYKTFSGFSIVAGGVPHALVVSPAGAGCATTSAFAVTTVTPTTGQRNDIVVAGTVAKKNVQVLTLPIPITIPGRAQAWIAHASPSSPATVSLGYFTAATGTGVTAISNVTFKGTPPAFNLTTLPAVASDTTKGIGFYVGTAAVAATATAPAVPAGLPLASLYAGAIPPSGAFTTGVPFPSAATANTADASNAADQIPYGANDVILDGVVVDAPAGGTSPALIIGVYDSATLGF